MGDLLLHVWLHGDPPAADYMGMDIPGDLVADADAIRASGALTSGGTPQLVLPSRAPP